MKLLLGPVLSAIASLALPLSGQASLPKGSDTLIAPNKSIRGVTLGDHRSQVTGAWGANPG